MYCAHRTLAAAAICLAAGFLFVHATPAQNPDGVYQGPGSGQGATGAQAAPRHNGLMLVPTKEHPLMKIGTPAPDFHLIGIDDKIHTLSEFSKGKLLVVYFESVHCPVSQNYEGRMKALYYKYHPMGVEFVAINPNNPSAVRLAELDDTDLTDSLADMKIRARQRQIPWPYLYDGATQQITQIFGAIATPHVFIFDGERKLRYEGRLDDNQVEALVKVHDAADAIDELLAGQPVAFPNRPAFGCSTKWIEKNDDVKKEWEKICSQPVTITQASADDVKALRQNDGNRVEVVHFWSLRKSAPASDFSGLETTFFMYESRPYKYVTVNTDAAAKNDKVLDYLKSQHAYNSNVQLAEADLKTAEAAFGTTWKASEEFTAVIAPGGMLIYTHKGPVDVQDVRHAVLQTLPENPRFPGQKKYWNELQWR